MQPRAEWRGGCLWSGGGGAGGCRTDGPAGRKSRLRRAQPAPTCRVKRRSMSRLQRRECHRATMIGPAQPVRLIPNPQQISGSEQCAAVGDAVTDFVESFFERLGQFVIGTLRTPDGSDLPACRRRKRLSELTRLLPCASRPTSNCFRSVVRGCRRRCCGCSHQPTIGIIFLFGTPTSVPYYCSGKQKRVE